MIVTIPPQNTKKYTQANSGDFDGDIYLSKNITFDNVGYIGLEKRTRNLIDSAVATYLVNNPNESIQRIVNCDLTKSIWVMGTNKLAYLNNQFTLTQDATSGSPTMNSNAGDMIGFFANCTVSSTTITQILAVAGATTSAIDYFDGTTWRQVIGLSVVLPNRLAIMENFAALAVGGGNLVQLVSNGGGSGAMTPGLLLTLPANFVVTSMDWNNNLLYIGTLDTRNKEAMVFTWDGSSTSANAGYPVKAKQVCALRRYDSNGVVAITSIGQLVRIDTLVTLDENSELAHLPIYNMEKDWIGDSNQTLWSLPILHGGMAVDKYRIFIGVNAQYSTPQNGANSDYFENNFISGVYCYDPSVGLYHKYSVDGAPRTLTGAITTSNVNLATGVITIPSAICPPTGTPVFYDDGNNGNGSWITPIAYDTRYYVIQISPTTLQLATTYANATAAIPVPITLTSQGNSAQFLAFCPVNGYGGTNQMIRALMVLKQVATVDGLLPPTSQATRLLFGSFMNKINATTQNTGLHAPETKQENRGYFITTMNLSENITDTFQKFYIKYIPMVNDYDAIIIKYRPFNTLLYGNKIYTATTPATWTSSNTFTTADALMIPSLVIGYEVEITNGEGSGYIAHITNVSSPVNGVYTVTIDENLRNITAGNTFYFTVDNWTKSEKITISSVGNNDGYAEIVLNAKYSQLEIKVELRGESVYIAEMQLISAINKKSV